MSRRQRKGAHVASITEDDERVGSDTPPNSVLTDGEVELFWERGYHVIHDALSPDEISHYRRSILDLVPRDLAFPASWSCSMGRMKPYQVSNGERDQTIDTPELIPLLGNPKCYAVAAQLLRSRRLPRSTARWASPCGTTPLRRANGASGSTSMYRSPRTRSSGSPWRRSN